VPASLALRRRYDRSVEGLRHQGLKVRAFAGSAIAALALVAAAPPAAQAAFKGTYVALGDSYTSAPLVLFPTGRLGCGQSDHNYPHLVAGEIEPLEFRDVSCGSATTDHLRERQNAPGGGINPPQFNALDKGVRLVTMGMGGNDAGIAGTGADCARYGLSPEGSPCREAFTVDGVDLLHRDIDDTEAKLRRAVNGIHRRAPRAEVLLVGYPAAAPADGVGCWPLVPVTGQDLKWLDSGLRHLNRVIRRVARRHDAHYADVYTRTVGHDACEPPGTRWFEGIILTSPAFPLHPNAQGEASMAVSVLRAIGRLR
jgi:hypothetical protein